MRPKVYKVKSSTIEELKVDLSFLPYTKTYTAGGAGFDIETCVDVVSLPNSVVLRTIDFVIVRDQDGKPISRDFAGINYQHLNNTLLTQDEEGNLNLVYSSS
jgi:hypothetical protein